jgi:hypothetical protein
MWSELVAKKGPAERSLWKRGFEEERKKRKKEKSRDDTTTQPPHTHLPPPPPLPDRKTKCRRASFAAPARARDVNLHPIAGREYPTDRYGALRMARNIDSYEPWSRAELRVSQRIIMHEHENIICEQRARTASWNIAISTTYTYMF